MEYGDRIRFLRSQKGLTQDEMAQLVGKSLSAYKLWESSSNEPSISSLVFMADYFNVSLDFLVGRPTEFERNAVSEFENKLLPTQRGEYISLLEKIQNSLTYENLTTLELCTEDEQLLKIKSMQILAEALYRIHSLPDIIEVKVLKASDMEMIDKIDNNEILIDANVTRRQLEILQQAFQDIQKTMLKYILNLGLKINNENV